MVARAPPAPIARTVGAARAPVRAMTPAARATPVAVDTAPVPGNTVKLSPRVRSELLENGAIASIPLQLIGPFLNEAVVLSQDQLAAAPRIVATQEGRLQVSRGELAYVRGDLAGARSFSLFRQSKPLRELGPEELDAAVASDITPIDDVRSTGEYRLHCAKSVTREFLRELGARV